MLFLLLLLSCRHLAASNQDHDCVQIHRWSNITYREQVKERCSFKCDRKCEERSEEVCISVPVTRCEAVPFADCQDIKELHKIRDDKIQVKELDVRSCRPGPTVNITEVKQMPVCEDVTKEMCDSRWEVDELTGAKVWAGKVNCREVTWQDCRLEDRQVVEQVQTNLCEVTETLKFDEAEEMSVVMPIIREKCVPEARVVCEHSKEHKCTTVTWQHCTEQKIPSCNKFTFLTPSQEEQHHVRCPTNYGGDQTV